MFVFIKFLQFDFCKNLKSVHIKVGNGSHKFNGRWKPKGIAKVSE